MKLTKRQREQVVELLADAIHSDNMTFIRWAAIQLDRDWTMLIGLTPQAPVASMGPMEIFT